MSTKKSTDTTKPLTLAEFATLGGLARAKALTPERRLAIAQGASKAAALKRIENRKQQTVKQPTAERQG